MESHEHEHDHTHDEHNEHDMHHHDDEHHEHEEHGEPHGHVHGVTDPAILTSERGIWAVKWSFALLLVTALFQIMVVWLSGSIALLADTIHNFGDASTAIPLWFAFSLGRRKPSQRFTYGYGRIEDLAGVVVVLTILFSAVVAGYESIYHIFHRQPVQYLWAVAVASIIGFVGNEGVALFRIRVGKEIGSAALIADGYHARIDGLTSLAVLIGAFGVWLGYPLADPVVGLLITIAILRIVWESVKMVFSRLLDGVDPEVVDEIRHAALDTEGVREVTEVRVRWLGHRLHAEVNISVDPQLSVVDGHDTAMAARHNLLHHLTYLSNATVHVDPAESSGEEFHAVQSHSHDDLPAHAHA